MNDIPTAIGSTILEEDDDHSPRHFPCAVAGYHVTTSCQQRRNRGKIFLRDERHKK